MRGAAAPRAGLAALGIVIGLIIVWQVSREAQAHRSRSFIPSWEALKPRRW